jgi:dimethylamine corrinoid protein
MLEVNGFEVSDLGVDVPADRFVAEAERTGAQVIALSSLLTTTAPYMRTIISTVRESSIGEKCAIVIGGAATSSAFAEDISADGWAENAVDAVKLVEGLISLRTS